jgi:hypothetical protein
MGLRITWVSATVLAATVGCVGDIGDGPGAGATIPKGSSTPTEFVCDEGMAPGAQPLRRLSRAQYANTVRDVVRFALPGEADAALASIEPLFGEVPDDLRIGPDKHYAGFTHMDQAVQQDHVDATYAIAYAVGAALTASTARLGAAASACSTDADGGNDAACLDDFIRSFGERVLRRAPTDEDVAFYRTPAGAPPYEPADYADVVALLMTAPHALYLVEHAAEDDIGHGAPLDAYELAARLSYHFWQTMPDEELFAAARSGALLEDGAYEAQVERVFTDARTRAAVANFYSEWLENTTLGELDSRVGTPIFDAFAGDSTPGAELRERMLAEVVDAAVYYTFDTQQGYEDFFASTKSFAKTDDLAAIYGVAPWDGAGEPPDFPDPERVGLITRAAYVASGSADTRPIMKGVFIRKALLCDDIPPPPANAAANPPMLSGSLTTRQVVEELTGTGVCAGCHAPIINPLGFATEGFDALGRSREEQTFYDETGLVTGKAPVDTKSVPHIDAADESPSNGPADVVALILASDKPRACFARQYFRHTFGRMEDLDADACALAAVNDALEEGAPLADALRAVAMSPSFRRRTFE